MKTNILTILVVLLISGCRPPMDSTELNRYLTDPGNGYTQEKNINGIKYGVLYRPTEALVLQELSGTSSISKEKVEQVYTNYRQYHYILLSISQQGQDVLHSTNDYQHFSRMFHQMAFNLGQHVELTTSRSDTLNLVDSHLTRMFGYSESNDILFVFEREKETADSYTFHINEFGLGTGNTRVRFDSKEVLKRLKIKL